MNRRMLLPLACMAGLLGSCDYDLVIHDRFEQAEFSNLVDILWVVDSSNSMEENQVQLAENFDALAAALADPTGGEAPGVLTVSTLVDSYLGQILERERFLDFQMGFITMDLTSTNDGDRGSLRTLGTGAPVLLTPGQDDLLTQFQELVQVGVRGAGTEYGFEAAIAAVCKSLPNAGMDLDPDVFDTYCGNIPGADLGANDGFLREGSSLVVIFVTDEGDGSYIAPVHDPDDYIDACVEERAGERDVQCVCNRLFFQDFFTQIDHSTVFAAVGPSGREDNYECNSQGSPSCSINFYTDSTADTGGVYLPIEQPTEAGVCERSDFGAGLSNLGALISNLARSWRLTILPDLDSMLVYVNDNEVPRSELDSDTGLRTPGWFFNSERQSIEFSGEFVPEYDAIVDVYYLPLAESGPPLPF